MCGAKAGLSSVANLLLTEPALPLVRVCGQEAAIAGRHQSLNSPGAVLSLITSLRYPNVSFGQHRANYFLSARSHTTLNAEPNGSRACRTRTSAAHNSFRRAASDVEVMVERESETFVRRPRIPGRTHHGIISFSFVGLANSIYFIHAARSELIGAANEIQQRRNAECA